MKRSDLFTLLMLFCMLGAAVSSISSANWMPGLGIAGVAMALGLIAGTALAYSNFTSWMAHVTSFVYGLFVVGLIGGTHPSIPDSLEWRERVYVLMDKIILWAREAINNGTSREGLIFVLILCALFWLLGYTAAWYSFRYRRIWHVVLPAGVTLFSNIYYYAGPVRMELYLVIFLVTALILLVESHLADREETWLRERVRFARGLRTSFTLAGVGIAAVALVFAWRAPQLATSEMARSFFSQLENPYNELLARWNRLFTTLENNVQQTVETHQSAFTLGGPRNLTDDPVMDVIALPMRYYWRAVSYDNYDGKTWVNTFVDARDVRPDQSGLPLTAYQARLIVSPQFSLYRGTDSVYVPGLPQAANVPASAVYATMDDGTLEVMQLRLPSPLLPGNRYVATGALSVADASQLRDAGRDIPRWVAERYVQLPDNISPAVRQLASNIVGAASNDFDKAVAVERWLRANIVYDETIEAPPPGVEGSEYLLFRTKRGYCTYYSTAMVVMLRSQGVPARVVSGYAQGSMAVSGDSPSTATYNVKVKDAHTWVEVYFPQYGWVEFEPTAGQPELMRIDPQQFSATPTPEPQPEITPEPTPTPEAPVVAAPAPEPPASNPWQDVLKWLSGVAPLLLSIAPFALVIGAVIVLMLLGLRTAEESGFGHLPPIQRAYAMLSRWATWMGIGHENTPYEQAQQLSQRAPNTGAPAQTITQLYVANRYGAAEPEAQSEQVARTEWQNARRELRRTWLRLRLRRLTGRR